MKEQLESFLKKYDPGHNLSFNAVKFRPGAARTTPFGIDITTPEYTPLRLHLAVDSGFSSLSQYEIYCPFDMKEVKFHKAYGSFGTLLVLYTHYDFEIRIAHLDPEEFSPELKSALDNKTQIKAGSLLGNCGNIGLSFGKHAHTEIVSSSLGLTILNSILEEKFNRDLVYLNYNEKEISNFIEAANIPKIKGKVFYQEEFDRRQIKFINNYQALRTDYHSKEKRIFYSSLALFGM